MITFLNLLAKAFRKKKAPLPRPEVSKEIELINSLIKTETRDDGNQHLILEFKDTRIDVTLDDGARINEIVRIALTILTEMIKLYPKIE